MKRRYEQLTAKERVKGKTGVEVHASVLRRQRYLIAYIDADQLAKPLHCRKYTWHITLYWYKPSMSRESALKVARERGCKLDNGGRLIWFPVWQRNTREGKFRRQGAGTVHETSRFDEKEAAQKAAAQESANTVPPFKWLRPAPLHPVTQYVIG